MADPVSSTHVVPDVGVIPAHVAMIMDGNGRWAKQRGLPRVEGHRNGVESVRATVRACGELGVKYLTLYAFSVENWNRPQDEVDTLMKFLARYLKTELAELQTYLTTGGAWTGSDAQMNTKAAGLARLVAGSSQFQFV